MRATTSRGREVRQAVRAETLKLTSLPATFLAVAGAFAASVVLAIAFAAAGGKGTPAPPRNSTSASRLSATPKQDSSFSAW